MKYLLLGIFLRRFIYLISLAQMLNW